MMLPPSREPRARPRAGSFVVLENRSRIQANGERQFLVRFVCRRLAAVLPFQTAACQVDRGISSAAVRATRRTAIDEDIDEVMAAQRDLVEPLARFELHSAASANRSRRSVTRRGDPQR
jgi:hypothetical protein